jgi:uncharacterized protein YndB with AHSA1/START domain
MTIAPVRHSVEVNGAPARVFELFTARMGSWWPMVQTPAPSRAVNVVIEPGADGRWYEVDADGVETQWGKVIAWDPPHRLVLGWQLGKDWRFDRDLLMEVELAFTDAGEGRTLISLEHRDFEKYGAIAEERRMQIDSGWPERLADFVAFVQSP